MRTNWKMLGSLFLFFYLPIALWGLLYMKFRDLYILLLIILPIYYGLLYIFTKVFSKQSAFFQEVNQAFFTKKYSINNRNSKVKMISYIPPTILFILILTVDFTGVFGDQVFGTILFSLVIFVIFNVLYQSFIQFTKFNFEK